MCKLLLICPVCNNMASYNSYNQSYECYQCNWSSKDSNTLDISYKDMKTAPLSNLFPHTFIIDEIKCSSFESFIQSLREENIEMQKCICSNYSGMMAYKMRLSLNDWRKTGYVYWKGNPILRISDDYLNLISRAYDALFEQNIVFRELLKRYKDFHFIHSIGCDNISETLLTEIEFRNQLNRLKKYF